MKNETRLVAAQSLAPDQIDQIRALADLCNARDGLELTLNLHPTPPPGETNQFLYYCDGVLTGFCSMWPGNNSELSGMVHPDYRRRGIGRELFGVAQAEIKRRGAKALLICEQDSPSGQAFVAAIGLPRDLAEHRMELQAFVPAPPADQRFHLRRATLEDVDTLAHVTVAAFGDPPEQTRQSIERLIATPNQRFYLAEWEREPVGALRTEDYDHRTFIYGFGVVPERRGRGLGRQILSHAIETRQHEGRTAFALEVETDNVPALALYRSCGFEIVRTYEYFRVAA